MTVTTEPLDPELVKAANLLFAQQCDFMAGADSIEIIPSFDITEIAFAGRSNVGKSSLLNALTNRNSLARVSHTPGRTKQLNFFSLANRLMLVDMPGYGYAKASKKEVQGWGELIHSYLRGRVNLRRVCLLIDSRHGLKPNDLEIMELLDVTAVNYQIVLTKVDKLSKSEMMQRLAEITAATQKRPAAHPEVILTSSREKEGVEALRVALAGLV